MAAGSYTGTQFSSQTGPVSTTFSNSETISLFLRQSALPLVKLPKKMAVDLLNNICRSLYNEGKKYMMEN
jgi:hypothetical protein